MGKSSTTRPALEKRLKQRDYRKLVQRKESVDGHLQRAFALSAIHFAANQRTSVFVTFSPPLAQPYAAPSPSPSPGPCSTLSAFACLDMRLFPLTMEAGIRNHHFGDRSCIPTVQLMYTRTWSITSIFDVYRYVNVLKPDNPIAVLNH